LDYNIEENQCYLCSPLVISSELCRLDV